MKAKTTRRALLMSSLSLLLCVSMLVGTTFAWFTDSVTSGNNIIKSGNLDVVLEYKNNWEDDWKVVDNNTKVFKEGALYEPGYTEVVFLRVSNAGSLALKYNLMVGIAEEKPSTNVYGETFKLSDYLQIGTYVQDEYSSGFNYANILMPTMFGTREAAIANVSNLAKLSTADSIIKSNAPVLPGDQTAQVVALVLTMPETVGNEANYKSGVAAPEINLNINLFATQMTQESDSFGPEYDKDAAVATIEAAEKLMAENKDATLAGCNEPNGILNVPAAYTGTLTLVNSTLKSVQAEKDAKIVIGGAVTINAKGGAARAAAEAFDGSAISVNGKLTVSGNGTLTAIAADVDGAFGIGGMNATEINISDIRIAQVSGSYVQPNFVNDTKYGKSEPEGGAAIGSGYNGAVINLKNVTIDNALGGSKAAGIGARYWTGVTINIEDSVIYNVEGGNASAGIGSSRVSSGATENGTTINIKNSTITAKGGECGAGIGSGYDTHCLSKQPLCTLNIEGSTINATGGKYAAGIGSGYHNAALAGEIKNSNVTAVSGTKFYKDAYTQAMDIGFGVVDPAREGKQTTSYLIYNGDAILFNAEKAETYDEIYDAFYSGKTAIVEENITLDNMIGVSGSDVNSVFLNGAEISTIVDRPVFYALNGGTVIVGGDGIISTNNPNGYSAPVYATSSGTAIVNGGTYEMGETNKNYHMYAQNSGTIIINDGTFISTDESAALVYCINGFVEINGGFFQNTANPKAALLSMGNNLNYVDNQKITLSGGTFVNWNPMNSAFAHDWPQCPALIVLADGYVMTSETQANGDIWYTVVPEV